MRWLHRFRLVALAVLVPLALVACGQSGTLRDDPIGSLLPSSSTGLGSESASPSPTAEPDPDRPGFNRWYAASGVFAVSLPSDCIVFTKPSDEPQNGFACATYDSDHAPSVFESSDFTISVVPTLSECCPADGQSRESLVVDGMKGWYRVSLDEGSGSPSEDGFSFRILGVFPLPKPIRFGTSGQGVLDVLMVGFRAGGDTEENRRIAVEVIRSVEVFER